MMSCRTILFTKLLLILLNFVASEEERFFWENDYVGKPVNFYHGAAYQIPVIEGDIAEIQCKVRAVSEDPYTIIWDSENFHANTTGKTVLVNNTDGDEYAQITRRTLTTRISSAPGKMESSLTPSPSSLKFMLMIH